MSIKSSPNTAPSYALHREGVAAADSDITVFTKKDGCNATMYKYAHIQIVPSDDANPNVGGGAIKPIGLSRSKRQLLKLE